MAGRPPVDADLPPPAASAGGGAESARAPSLRDCRVLVVEDNHRNLLLIKTYLETAGITRLAFAADGAEGLVRVATFDPDLVILDIVMPNMDGFEFLRRLRGESDRSDLPVLVETGLEAPDERRRIFAAGATDLVTKPINGAELIARASIHLENRLLIRNLKAYRARIEEELRMAREMQEALLPAARQHREVEERYGVRLESHFEPSSELGGDVWGLVPLDEARIGLFITDFSGHGVTAALNTFRLHTMIGDLRDLAGEPARFLEAVNARLVRLIPRGQFATMLYGVFDAGTGRFTYAGAAAPAFLRGRRGSPVLERLECRSLPLGIVASARYDTRAVTVSEGAFLLFYSDALYECLGRDGAALEEEGVETLVRELAGGSGAEPLVPQLVERFHRAVPPPLSDDLTVVRLAR